MIATTKMTLNQDITLVCAFRYALGRMTYSVDSVASEIERQADEISVKSKYLMIKEIGIAIADKKAGMQMDEERWKKCRAILRRSIREFKDAPKEAGKQNRQSFSNGLKVEDDDDDSSI